MAQKSTKKKVPTKKVKPQEKKHTTSAFAIVSMVAGILALLFSWMFFGWLLVIVAIVFGFLALSEIKKEKLQGRGMAIAGLVTGFVALAILIIVTIVMVLLFGTIFAGLFAEVVDEVGTAQLQVVDDDVSMSIDFTNPEMEDVVVRDGVVVQGTP